MLLSEISPYEYRGLTGGLFQFSLMVFLVIASGIGMLIIVAFLIVITLMSILFGGWFLWECSLVVLCASATKHLDFIYLTVKTMRQKP